MFLLAAPKQRLSSRGRISVSHVLYSISQSNFDKWYAASTMEETNELNLNLNAFPIKIIQKSTGDFAVNNGLPSPRGWLGPTVPLGPEMASCFSHLDVQEKRGWKVYEQPRKQDI
jgi:hypothetical protein